MNVSNNSDNKITFENSDTIAYINESQIDVETYKQIVNINTNPTVSHCRIMPDCHAGAGCVIGFTSHLNEKIIPQLIGGDIGCGMMVYPINTHDERRKLKDGKYEKKFDTLIQNLIPIGPNIHDEPVIQLEQYVDFLNECHDEANKFADTYKMKFEIDISLKVPKYDLEWMKTLCLKLKIDLNFMLRYMCTLGGGNHFIEIDEDDDNVLYLTVHTGSRMIGREICLYHQAKIIGDKKYLENDDAYEYYFDMIFAQKYAHMNRTAIISYILNEANIIFDKHKIIESIHNYIDFDDMIIRKGAIKANKGQKCVVALNMRDGILICEGKGNKEWNSSCAHGAGRIVTRNKAREKFLLKQYVEDMKDVYSTCINNGTIDEAPRAYKNSEFIKNALHDTVDIVVHAKSRLNIKGTYE